MAGDRWLPGLNFSVLTHLKSTQKGFASLDVHLAFLFCFFFF